MTLLMRMNAHDDGDMMLMFVLLCQTYLRLPVDVSQNLILWIVADVFDSYVYVSISSLSPHSDYNHDFDVSYHHPAENCKLILILAMIASSTRPVTVDG